MVNGPGRSDGVPPDPIDGEPAGEGADETQGKISQPPPSATPRGNIDPRLGGLIPDSDGSASTGRTPSFRSLPDAVSMEMDALVARASQTADLRALSHELLPEPLRLAYERSEKLNERAAAVCDVGEVKAVLAQEGVEGPPPLPDNALRRLMPRFTGGREFAQRERPKPLCTLAMRISSEEFPADQRFQALVLVLDAIGKVAFKPHRIEPLAEMAEATPSVPDDAQRTRLFRAVLRSAQGLWEESKAAPDKASEINSGDYVHMLVSLSANSRELYIDRDSTLAELRRAIYDEYLTQDERRIASSGLDD